VVLLSTTEGEDKPLKYPPMFHSAHVAIVTKSDLTSAAGFNREQALANLKRVSHHARIFELSAKTGEGMKAWLEFLEKQRSAV
jgi:hydrogenase nickel incorporation protein HypB